MTIDALDTLINVVNAYDYPYTTTTTYPPKRNSYMTFTGGVLYVDKYDKTGIAFKNGKPAGLEIEKVIFNEPATIILWNDGTKTVVKAQNEPFDKEKGFVMACLKRILGNDNTFNKEIKKWVGSTEIEKLAGDKETKKWICSNEIRKLAVE